MFFLPTAGFMSDVGELRAKYKQLLSLTEQGPVYLLRHNQPQAVLLSIEEYSRLVGDSGRSTETSTREAKSGEADSKEDPLPVGPIEIAFPAVSVHSKMTSAV